MLWQRDITLSTCALICSSYEERISFSIMSNALSPSPDRLVLEMTAHSANAISAITITMTNFVLTLILFIPIPPNTSVLFYEPNFKFYLYFSTLCLFYHSIFDIFRDFIETQKSFVTPAFLSQMRNGFLISNSIFLCVFGCLNPIL